MFSDDTDVAGAVLVDDCGAPVTTGSVFSGNGKAGCMMGSDPKLMTSGES